MPTNNTARNVTAGKPAISGAIYRALRTASLQIPTSATATLDVAFLPMGYISSDGLKNNIDIDSDKLVAWGGDVVLPFEKSRTDEFKFKMIEVMNADVLKAVFGDSNVSMSTGTGGTRNVSVNVDSDEQADAVWVIDMIQRGNLPKRIVIPYGRITKIGEIVYKDDDAVGYDVTVLASADENSNTHYEYTTVPAVGGATGTT